MCTTPAPPSTACVATSIWSGTGEVNTAPGQAASSMPRPTKPPCSGSWPEPPPETSATFPCRGASARTTICAEASTRRMSPCAAARPASDSLTICSGSLSSLRIDWVTVAMIAASVRDRDAVLGGDGGLDRPLDLARLGEEVVDERGQAGAGEAGQHVDRDQLSPVRRGAADRRHELGTERARRVQRGAGDRAHDHDDRDYGASDHEAGELTRRAPVDDAKHREHQHERAEALRED